MEVVQSKEVVEPVENELLTVAEFAELAGVSKQAVYQRIKRETINCKHVGKQTYIYKSELDTLHIEQGIVKGLKIFNQDNSTLKAVEILEKEVDTLNRQLIVKDAQIEDLNRQLETLHRLLDQSQQLQMAAITKQSNTDNDDMSTEPGEATKEPAPTKRSWLKFWK